MNCCETLSSLLLLGLNNEQIAERLGISLRTVKSLRKEYRLRMKDGWSELNDDQLDEAISQIVGRHPNYGEKMVRGNLTANGINISRQRIRDSLRRVDPAGVEMRKKSVLHRRQYRVTGPNSLWHIDGNHKLIRWRIVIHGGVDGFSRLPVFLSPAIDNRAQTMFNAFKKGVMEFGLPQTVRSDKGGENCLVCTFMSRHPLRGEESRCFITGRSVHNQRIERFWRDMFTGCVSTFYELFYKMEDADILDHNNDIDIATLHYVFLPIIGERLESFRQSFMQHKIRTEHNRTPLQLWQNAVEEGHCIDVIPEEDFQTYGVPLLAGHVGEVQDGVNVPLGIHLTPEQQDLLQKHYGLGVSDLGIEEDQINYYVSVKEFLSGLMQNHV